MVTRKERDGNAFEFEKILARIRGSNSKIDLNEVSLDLVDRIDHARRLELKILKGKFSRETEQ